MGNLGADLGYSSAVWEIWEQLGSILSRLRIRSGPLLLAELNATVLAELRGDLALNFLRIMSESVHESMVTITGLLHGKAPIFVALSSQVSNHLRR